MRQVIGTWLEETLEDSHDPFGSLFQGQVLRCLGDGIWDGLCACLFVVSWMCLYVGQGPLAVEVMVTSPAPLGIPRLEWRCSFEHERRQSHLCCN
jgi:hypothetical protein